MLLLQTDDSLKAQVMASIFFHQLSIQKLSTFKKCTLFKTQC